MPYQSERTVVGLWLIFTCWAVTFTLIALWLALRFQMKMSSSARDRLLRRHRRGLVGNGLGTTRIDLKKGKQKEPSHTHTQTM